MPIGARGLETTASVTLEGSRGSTSVRMPVARILCGLRRREGPLTQTLNADCPFCLAFQYSHKKRYSGHCDHDDNSRSGQKNTCAHHARDSNHSLTTVPPPTHLRAHSSVGPCLCHVWTVELAELSAIGTAYLCVWIRICMFACVSVRVYCVCAFVLRM